MGHVVVTGGSWDRLHLNPGGGGVWTCVYELALGPAWGWSYRLFRVVACRHFKPFSVCRQSRGEHSAIDSDVNDNGKLDTKIFRIPKEPYGFSNNVSKKMKPPSYSESEFHFHSDNQVLNIKLK